ncbi:MAG: hypothetical protein GEU96_04865 [Propionibacteriales bacterium]|nr:hypothetical protein [Propionibacteriales bacterium]
MRSGSLGFSQRATEWPLATGGAVAAQSETASGHRGQATVHIQKRTSTGGWATVETANTGWEPWDVEDQKGWYHDSFTSYVPTPSQRAFRLYVSGTDKYQTVYSRTFTAVPWCE